VGNPPRFYRRWVNSDDLAGLTTFEVAVRETDLQIRAWRDLTSHAFRLVKRVRAEIETYAATHPGFLESLVPLPIPPDCTGVPLEMLRAAEAFGVGPMAAVAGAVAEAVGRGLLRQSPQVIVENGGDLFIHLERPARLALYGGEGSPFTRTLVVEVGAGGASLGVCTSSGTVGHSLSLGRADAVMVVADSAAFADAAATALANRIRGPEDIGAVIEEERSRGRLRGLLAIAGGTLGAWGEVRLHGPGSVAPEGNANA